MTVQILVGDCTEQLRTLPPASVNACITSPPYFGLRDYGHEGQIGMEPTPNEFVAALVAVFREVRRVLRDDGTLWLNLGDSYAVRWPSRRDTGRAGMGAQDRERATNPGSFWAANGLKEKDLIGIPWRVAFALQADGWHLRQDIIWHKPNPMPESVRDRCTKAHEYLFLLSKGPRYYFDGDAIKESATGRAPGNRNPVTALPGEREGRNANIRGQVGTTGGYEERNRRSVWTVATRPFKGAHFATFPPDLIEPCILAGCPKSGTVLDPFGGAGTTGLVAQQHGRNAVLCELNPEYAELARARIDAARERQEPLFA